MKLALALALMATPAAAAPPCGPHDAIIAGFAERYGETPRVAGLTADGKLLEILVSGAGTWTAILTTPTGLSCVVSVGQALVMIEPKKGSLN